MNTKLMLSVVVMLLAVSAIADAADANQGVFEYVIQKSDMSFEDASQALASQFSQEPFALLGTIDMNAGDACDYNARVFVVYDSVYSAALLAANKQTAPFATAERINLFQDEAGLHVSIVNPLCVHRTILMQGKKYTELFDSQRQTLRSNILEAVSGEESSEQYGQVRSKGLIGKTMGVMAGGPFDGKIKLVAEKSGDFEQTVKQLQQSLSESTAKWGLHLAYTLHLAEDVVVLGSTGPAMERKSFSIVNAGADKKRKGYACPGLAHAAAYPVEIVVVNDGGVKVYLVDMMYRMKLYFEDAGKIAFMKNMTMPGSLTKELSKQINKAMP